MASDAQYERYPSMAGRGQSPTSREAGLLENGSILSRSIYATLRISVPTIYEVYRGTYRRSDGDARLRWWSRRLLELVELDSRIIDAERFMPAAGKPTILMSNHQSLYDIPLILATLPGSIRMLTKKELFRVPIWGRGMKAGEFVSIDRKDHRQALRDLGEARRKMEDGILLWIAPEGTRSRDGRLGDFKKGGFMLAIETGARIFPIGIRGTRDILPAHGLRLRLGCSAELRIGHAIDAARYAVENREELMAEVERRICDLAGIATRHGVPAHEVDLQTTAMSSLAAP
jgi:1-acyl-sn-glycerol-3-phosphate acyltransferase